LHYYKKIIAYIYVPVPITIPLAITLVSDNVKDIILNYIAEKKGKATKNDVVRYMTDYDNPLYKLSRVVTLDVINEFESFDIINVSKGDRRGQAHYLSINDKNKFNQIKKELSDTESFIKQTNEYFRRRQTENLNEIGAANNSEDKEKQNKFDERIKLVIELDRLYRLTMHRILDDLYHLTITTNLSRQDSERFVKKIIELKAKLEYHQWTVKNEMSFFNLQIANMKKNERLIKQQGLDDYFEEKKLKDKFTDPLTAKVENFVDFLNLES
jgi:hypothetical protein